MHKLLEPTPEEVVQALLELQTRIMTTEPHAGFYTTSRDVTRAGEENVVG